MGHIIKRERWTTHSLDPVERPSLLYEYFVSGRGNFAWDMLRHDHCWPANGTQADKLQVYPGPTYNKLRSIKMLSHRQPEIDRWASFGWSVGNYDLEGS